MECKFHCEIFVYLRNDELIDTLWNVNNDDYKIEMERNAELIDTLWNVNEWEAYRSSPADSN